MFFVNPASAPTPAADFPESKFIRELFPVFG